MGLDGTLSVSDSVHSGRRVRHSRHGCAHCKQRRVRCSEERPSCVRCVKDGRFCEYILRLTWEDESKGRGVKHGRAASKSPMIEYTPPSRFIKRLQLEAVDDYGVYFINTGVWDLEETRDRNPANFHGSCRTTTPPLRKSINAYNLNNVNGSLLQYYHSQVCFDLTLVDDATNGYRRIVLPMALTHDSVMQSVLAVSALYLSFKQPSSPIDYYAVALRCKQKTLNSLRHELASPDSASSDSVLISMLMLCLLDITDDCQTSWATHLSAAAIFIANKTITSQEPSLSSFASKTFGIRDVTSRTACGALSKFNLVGFDNPHIIDNSFGCSPEMLEIISSITDLTRRMIDDVEMTQRLIALEKDLNNLMQCLPESCSFLPPPERLIILRTSKIIHTASKIYFYTSLHSALPTTPLIRTLVHEQISSLTPMPYLRSAHLWSIFVTALYASEDEERIFFLRQFDRLEQLMSAVAQTKAARAVVETVWKRRDLETDVSVKEGDKRNDWERLVRPMSEGLSLA